MNILLVGSGAREHAIVKALKRSTAVTQLFCVGSHHNPGIALHTEKYCVGDVCDIDAIVRFAKDHQITLALIGPEAPLEKGLADHLWQHAIPTIGPKQSLARIETSKVFARDLMQKYAIPGSPRYQYFQNLSGVEAFLQQLGDNGYVIKADGLMGGKGVKVAGDHLHSLAEAYAFCTTLIQQQHSFIIEEKLIGEEFSLLCFCDGTHVVFMPAVQDHKRAFVGDQGPNTGGMGSYSDANHSLPFLSEIDIETAQQINAAVIQALTTECEEKYIGILYGSFIATAAGIRVIEFNARFGDPEALNVLAILESDFLTICQTMTTGHLSADAVRFAPLATVCKYAVPEGYPDHPLKNFSVDIDQALSPEQLYLAAVHQEQNTLIATGSRTAAVVGVADTIFAAEKLAEAAIQMIRGPLLHRADIGTKALIEKRISHMQQLRHD